MLRDEWENNSARPRHLSVPPTTLDSYASVYRFAVRRDDQRAKCKRNKRSFPWYGKEYALDDFIVYTFYGHKREHSAQIAAFRDLLRREATVS